VEPRMKTETVVVDRLREVREYDLDTGNEVLPPLLRFL
jgi:hypothetical protein